MTSDHTDLQNVDAVTFMFGDSEAMCNALLDLIRAGRKTATCGALRDFGEGAEAMPEVGRRDIALNWDGCRALLLETIKVSQIRFCDVDEDFALAEGDNEDLERWRHDHSAYFERNGGFDDRMTLVCERFRLVHDFAEKKT